MSDADKILRELYINAIDCMAWLPIPATDISKITGVPLRRTKNILHRLQNEGLVSFQRSYMPEQFSYEGELEQEAFFYCGWELTEKGKDDDAFKEMKQKYEEEMDKMGKDLNDFYEKERKK